jgi:hypothetical protein
VDNLIINYQKDIVRGLGILIAYLVCLCLGNLVVKNILYKLSNQKGFLLSKKSLETDDDIDQYAKKQSSYLGIVERFFYILALQSQLGLLIPAWLVLKMTVRWGAWKDDEFGRLNFNNFLIGSTVNIIFGITSYFSILWINAYQTTDPIIETLIVYMVILFIPIAIIHFSFVIIFAKKKV